MSVWDILEDALELARVTESLFPRAISVDNSNLYMMVKRFSPGIILAIDHSPALASCSVGPSLVVMKN